MPLRATCEVCGKDYQPTKKGSPHLSCLRRFCAWPDCGKEFSPKASKQVYCTPACSRERRLANEKASRLRKTGRQCPWCGLTDASTGFHFGGECSACHSIARKNGRCTKHTKVLRGKKLGRPLRKPYHGRGLPPQCLKCEPRILQPGEFVVKLLHGGKTKPIHRSRNSWIKVGGRNWRLGDLKDQLREVVILVDEDAWVRGRIIARAVRGLDVRWPSSLEFETDKFLELLEELVHYLRLGECLPITIGWWLDKFRKKSKRDTGMRAWERFKKRLRDLGAPVESENVFRTQQDSPEVAIRVDRHKFIPVVEAECKRRRKARGDLDELEEL